VGGQGTPNFMAPELFSGEVRRRFSV
jgi:hypothetical protein